MRMLTSAIVSVVLPMTLLAADPDVKIDIDASKAIGQISPLVYGINHNDFSKRPHIPFTRQGGNRMTAWNWENNASNAGNDWQHQNDAYLGGGDTPGEVARSFLEPAMKAGKTAILTIPMAGYVAADKKGDGDVNKTPNYLETRFVKSHAKKNGKFTYPPDLNDKAVYQDEFVWWINQTFPPAARNGGQIFYNLDNEPDIWNGTHARIRPQKVTYAEMVQKSTELASAIKDVDKDAVVFGFVSYGYAGYMHLQDAPDANGRDFIEFFLGAMRDAEKQQGRRLMDVLDLHWYPEARGAGKRIVFGNSNEPGLVRARVQAPRSLWDANYKEDSWIANDVIHGPVNLLPRIREKIEKSYPGTKLAFTEYDFGGGNDISGAVAQADVLGIFGREGVFAAALWGGGPFIYAGFDAYLNYDGRGGAFGDEALQATSSNINDVAVHASRSSRDGRLVFVLINRAESAKTCQINVTGGAGGKARLYRVAGTTPKVAPAGEIDFASGTTVELPAMSVTTMAVQK